MVTLPALPKSGVAPSFRPDRDPCLGLRKKDAVVAQLVRAPVCGTGGRWFEPTQLYHNKKIPLWFQQRTDRPDVFARAKYKRRIQMALRMVALSSCERR